MTRCPLCGTENAPTQASCVACGQLLSPPPGTTGAGSDSQAADAGTVAGVGARASLSPTKGTLLGMPSPFAQSQSPAVSQPTPPPSAAEPPKPAGFGGKQTLLGFGTVSPFHTPGGAPPPPALPFEPPAAPAPAQPPGMQPALSGNKTLLGVAQPGIAPTHSSAPQMGSGAPQPLQGGKTLLGVARPGVAPTGRAPAPPPAVTPVRVSSPDLDIPGPPPAKRSNGVGLIIAAVVGALALGGIAFAFWPSGAPKLEVKGLRVGATGDEIVVHCADCKDGTRASLGASSSEFKNGEAVVKTESPLTVGEHRLELSIAPADGRTSTVAIAVPVAFRARAVLDHLTDDTPSASVEVSAPKGSKVTVDGQPVTLNDQGIASYAIDLKSKAAGESETAVSLSQAIPVTVTPPDGAERQSTVELRAGIAPLVLHSPGPRVVLGGGDLLLSGRTAPGVDVRIGSSNAKAGKDGRFVLTLRSPKAGTYAVLASGEALATRSVPLEVALVPSTTPELIGYDALRNSTGKRVAVRGRVVDARAQAEGSSFLLEVKTGCQTAPCLVGALYPARLVAGMPARDRELTVVGDVVKNPDGTPRVRVETFSK